MSIDCPSCGKDRWRTVRVLPEETVIERGGIFRTVETEVMECIHCAMPMTFYKADYIVPQGVV
jgi:hypothetical protein